jgi:hypothetical protein
MKIFETITLIARNSDSSVSASSHVEKASSIISLWHILSNVPIFKIQAHSPNHRIVGTAPHFYVIACSFLSQILVPQPI